MYKMRMKIAVCMIVFCVIVSIAFSGVLFVFQKNNIEKFSQSNAGIYLLNEKDVFNYEKDGDIIINKLDIIPSSDYNTSLFNEIYTEILPPAIFFFLFIFVMSFFLMVIVNILQNRNNQKIADELIKLQNGEVIVSDNVVFSKIYSEIEKKFQTNLNDYKRLNSYLAHEQKNSIAILQTTLEIKGQKEYIPLLNGVAASIDDVLTLSENRDISIVAAVDVSLICAEVVDTYKKTYSNIAFDFPENEDSEIIAKERWVYRAVSNLVDNAIKYGEGKEIKVSVAVKNDSVIICVKDEGIGICPEKQQQIFNNHYRVNELNRDGYGIGLSLISHVCDLCGGYVFVESQLGVGSTFVISFPKAN